MKVVTETPTLLVLKDKPISQIFVGIILALVGVVISPLIMAKGIVFMLIPLIFVLFGIATIFLTKFLTITIDKSVNKVNFGSTSLLGKKSQDIAVDQISEIAIQEMLTQDVALRTTNSLAYQNSAPKLNFVLIFYLKDGQGMPVPMGSTSGGFGINGMFLNMFSGRNKKIEIGNKIANFIGVPFKDNRAPTISDVVSEVGQMIGNKEENPTINNQTPTIQN